MLSELLNNVWDKSQESRACRVTALPDDRYTLDGKTAEKYGRRPARLSLSSLKDTAFYAVLINGLPDIPVGVTVSAAYIRVVRLDSSTADAAPSVTLAVMPLRLSDAFAGLKKGHSGNQKAVLNFLRIQVGENAETLQLIDKLRTLTWAVTAGEEAGKSSLSREVTEKAGKGGGGFPERVTLRVQPFDQLPYSVDLRAFIVVDHDAKTLALQANGGDWQRALDTVIDQAAAELQSHLPDAVPVYRGE